MNSDDWVRIPPKNTDESPEEIRRQRDLYRDVVQSMLHNEWKDVNIDDLQVDPRSREEMRMLIEELRRNDDGFIVIESPI